MTLKAARVNNSLTQLQASELLGITEDTVSNWERSKSYPDALMIKKIEEVYGVKYDDIIFLSKHDA